MHRSYYVDPAFGGSAKCVIFERYGAYENFSTPIAFHVGEQETIKGQVTLDAAPCYTCRNQATFVPENDGVPQEIFYAIYVDCTTCTILRHHYADNGYGCSFWRRADTMHEPADYCDFIYDENCGTAPKYEIYDASCI
ncbi:uncharacterized protein LOC119401359 [Rhipicephalus sanguineus]|uniref:uncharacterized protein LOC119401359 n=1 Tax=Rhipicephalus sanguineus TaxID=34632 RepID=UPI0018949733|nr:uncharacterized protein LOC119401359 [Rhipicephalus sanguineus]